MRKRGGSVAQSAIVSERCGPLRSQRYPSLKGRGSEWIRWRGLVDTAEDRAAAFVDGAQEDLGSNDEQLCEDMFSAGGLVVVGSVVSVNDAYDAGSCDDDVLECIEEPELRGAPDLAIVRRLGKFEQRISTSCKIPPRTMELSGPSGRPQ
jgi:hypothetical protein